MAPILCLNCEPSIFLVEDRRGVVVLSGGLARAGVGAGAAVFTAPPTKEYQAHHHHHPPGTHACPPAPPSVRGPSCVWLPGARLNIAHAALNSARAPPGAPALLWAAEGRPRDVRAISREEMRGRCLHVASCISARFRPGGLFGVVWALRALLVVGFEAPNKSPGEIRGGPEGGVVCRSSTE